MTRVWASADQNNPRRGQRFFKDGPSDEHSTIACVTENYGSERQRPHKNDRKSVKDGPKHVDSAEKHGTQRYRPDGYHSKAMRGKPLNFGEKVSLFDETSLTKLQLQTMCRTLVDEGQFRHFAGRAIMDFKVEGAKSMRLQRPYDFLNPLVDALVSLAARLLDGTEELALVQLIVNKFKDGGDEVNPHRHRCRQICASLGAERAVTVEDRTVMMGHGDCLPLAGDRHAVPPAHKRSGPRISVCLFFGSTKEYASKSISVNAVDGQLGKTFWWHHPKDQHKTGAGGCGSNGPGVGSHRSSRYGNVGNSRRDEGSGRRDEGTNADHCNSRQGRGDVGHRGNARDSELNGWTHPDRSWHGGVDWSGDGGYVNDYGDNGEYGGYQRIWGRARRNGGADESGGSSWNDRRKRGGANARGSGNHWTNDASVGGGTWSQWGQ